MGAENRYWLADLGINQIEFLARRNRVRRFVPHRGDHSDRWRHRRPGQPPEHGAAMSDAIGVSCVPDGGADLFRSD